MTCSRRGPLAALIVITALLAGCAAPAPASTQTSDEVPAASPGPGDEASSPPGTEICEVQREWDKIDSLLVTAGRENPPAPSYTDAMYQLQAVIPPNSIKADWLELRGLVEAYVPIVTRGDSAELAAQADEVTAIAEVQLRLFGYFQSLCS